MERRHGVASFFHKHIIFLIEELYFGLSSWMKQGADEAKYTCHDTVVSFAQAFICRYFDLMTGWIKWDTAVILSVIRLT